MTHLKPMTRRPAIAQEGVTTPLESAIIFILNILFGEWLNGPQVISNLADFYAKTPDGV